MNDTCMLLALWTNRPIEQYLILLGIYESLLFMRTCSHCTMASEMVTEQSYWVLS